MTLTATTDFDEAKVEEKEFSMEPVTLSIQGAIQYTGMKESRIRALVRTGVLPVKYVGGTQDKFYYVLVTEGLKRYMLSLPDDPSELPTK